MSKPKYEIIVRCLTNTNTEAIRYNTQSIIMMMWQLIKISLTISTIYNYQSIQAKTSHDSTRVYGWLIDDIWTPFISVTVIQ